MAADRADAGPHRGEVEDDADDLPEAADDNDPCKRSGIRPRPGGLGEEAGCGGAREDPVCGSNARGRVASVIAWLAWEEPERDAEYEEHDEADEDGVRVCGDEVWMRPVAEQLPAHEKPCAE